jgi:hypothetical protein
VKHGFFTGDMQGVGMLKVQVLQPQTRQVLWEDVVRAEYTKPDQMMALESDHQEVVEKLYVALLTTLLERIPPDTASSPPGSPAPSSVAPATPASAAPRPPAVPPPPRAGQPMTFEQARAKCWTEAGNDETLQSRCSSSYGPRPASLPAAENQRAVAPPAPIAPPAASAPAVGSSAPAPVPAAKAPIITPAKKTQIDLLQRLRDGGSITADQFEIERAKIILAPAE